METPKLIMLDTGRNAATKLSEIAPGQFGALAINPADVPRYGVIRMVLQSDGSYLPVLKSYGEHRRCCAQLLKDVGLGELSIRGFYRLLNAGFVESSRITPLITMVDLASLVAHVEAAKQPGFWTAERMRKFRNAADELARDA